MAEMMRPEDGNACSAASCLVLNIVRVGPALARVATKDAGVIESFFVQAWQQPSLVVVTMVGCFGWLTQCVPFQRFWVRSGCGSKFK